MKEGDLKYHLAGWILFLLCAGLFVTSSLKNGDTLALIGSLLFLVACIAFLVPLIVDIRIGRTGRESELSSRAKRSVAEGSREPKSRRT